MARRRTLKKLLSRVKKRHIMEVFITSIIIKIIYDSMVLMCLPDIYIEEITYGVDFVPSKLFLGYLIYSIIALISIIFIKKKRNSISTGLVILLDLFYVPVSSSYYLNNAPFEFLLSVSLFFVLLPLINYYFFNNAAPLIESKRSYLKMNKTLFAILCIIVSLMCVAYSYNYNGLNLSLDINSVYDVRADFVGSTNAFTSILFHFGGQIVTAGALYGLIKRKPLLIVACVFGQLCIFSIARQKSDLLILLIVVGIWILSLLNIFNFVKRHLSSFICLAMILTLLEFSIIGGTTLFGLFVRRIMYFPALLNYYYFDYFSFNTLLVFSQDVFLINRLNVGIYNVPVITLINEAYFGGHVPSPNTGLFGEAFMHLGYLGVIVFPFIIIFLSKLFTSSISIFPKEVRFILIVQFFLTMMNIPITGGVFVVTYFLWVPFALLIKKRPHKTRYKVIKKELQTV